MAEQYRSTPEEESPPDLLKQVNTELTQKAKQSWEAISQSHEHTQVRDGVRTTMDDLTSQLTNLYGQERGYAYSGEIIEPAYETALDANQLAYSALSTGDQIRRLAGDETRLNQRQAMFIGRMAKILDTMNLPGGSELKEVLQENGFDWEEEKWRLGK